jgi:hypothetical protein
MTVTRYPDQLAGIPGTASRLCFFNTLVRIPDSSVPATTLASLSTTSCSKTCPKIIVSIVGSADGFRDTNRGRLPAGQAPRFL